ncbi:MAG: DUF4878 domain-containing protein [Actinomycetota bacterium]|nr:DUF4878 domain-containing protein [Actinomycetota bacterium]
MKVRKPLAAAILAGATVLATAACSDEASDTASSIANEASAAVASAAGEAASQARDAVSGAVSTARDAVLGLSTEDAQNTLRTAVDPASTTEELEGAIDTNNPETISAFQAYAESSNAAGYTPDVYTVTDVNEQGQSTAVATVSVASPHAPAPVDIQLDYVRVGTNWKLSADAVDTLTSMGDQHSG